MLLVLCPLGAGELRTSNIKADEEIVFFPAVAWSSSSGELRLPIQGCVSEPEPRRIALAALRKCLDVRDVELSPAEDAIFAERARLFMVDNERRKRVVIQLGSERYALGKTGSDGWFRGEVVLSAPQARALRQETSNCARSISFQACLPEGDSRVFAGSAMLVEAAGLLVVSDIDDTIKISHVTDRSALLRSTFLEQFKPVPGMPELYRAWARTGDFHFCYVSASPWQLFPPLSEFISASAFPEGTFHMRQIKWNGRSAWSLFQSPEKHKFAAIEPLLEKFPQRRFVFVGDSGERDPEIYGALARKYRQQVAAVLIREVMPAPNGERYEAAFRGLDRSVWLVFRDPAALTGALDPARKALKSVPPGTD